MRACVRACVSVRALVASRQRARVRAGAWGRGRAAPRGNSMQTRRGQRQGRGGRRGVGEATQARARPRTPLGTRLFDTLLLVRAKAELLLVAPQHRRPRLHRRLGQNVVEVDDLACSIAMGSSAAGTRRSALRLCRAGGLGCARTSSLPRAGAHFYLSPSPATPARGTPPPQRAHSPTWWRPLSPTMTKRLRWLVATHASMSARTRGSTFFFIAPASSSLSPPSPAQHVKLLVRGTKKKDRKKDSRPRRLQFPNGNDAQTAAYGGACRGRRGPGRR